jgi:AraC-like DNA-binding protein
MARPLAEVDEALLEKLTKLQLSDKVIADCLGVSVDTLHRRFADKMEQWRSKSKSKIADVLFDEAVNKREPWALKALAQKHLDYSDRVKSENETANTHVIQGGEIDYAKLAQMVKDAK